ncbi:TPA: GNAT family N-acetyltransferase [Vibrio parahaemolyticus]
MLDLWNDAVCHATQKAGFDPSVGEGFDLANMVLFSLMKSPHHHQLFSNAEIEIPNEAGFSRIVLNPDSEEETYLTAFDHEPTTPSTTDKWRLKDPSSNKAIQSIINHLPSDIRSPMYSVASDKVEIKIFSRDLGNANPAIDVLSQSCMSHFDYTHLRDVYNHYYFNDKNNEDFIVAVSDAGIIGIASMFRHTEDQYGYEAISLSGITVTEAFRNHGVARSMIEALVNHTQLLNLPLIITSPTELGKESIYKTIVRDFCYRDALIMEPFFGQFVSHFHKLDLTQTEKSILLNEIKVDAEKLHIFDFSKKQSSINVSKTLKKLLGERALLIKIMSSSD